MNKDNKQQIKVKCISDFFDSYACQPFIKDKVYDVISIENGWYRIMTELGEDYLFPPEMFAVIEE